MVLNWFETNFAMHAFKATELTALGRHVLRSICRIRYQVAART